MESLGLEVGHLDLFCKKNLEIRTTTAVVFEKSDSMQSDS